MRKYTLNSEKVFTAGQIADTVGVSPRAVRSALAKVPAAGVSIRSGNVSDGYAFETLPDRLKEKIENQQLSLNYRSPQAVLESPKKQWQPRLPLSQQPPEAVEYAHCLKRALAFYLANHNDLSFRSSELLARAGKDWEAAFRKPVQRRHIERMIAVVLERDNGREEFDRIEIYLPGGLARKNPASDRSGQLSLPELESAVDVVADVSVLTPQDRGTIWRAAMGDFETLMALDPRDKKAKRQILDFLLARVPRLAESRNALRVQFERKWTAYSQEGVTALRDKRAEKSGCRSRKIYTGPESLSPDERLLLGRANTVGGGLSQAFRELHRGIEIVPGKMMQFSEEFRSAYSFDPRSNKSYVPQSLRDKLRPLLEAIKPLNHGPKAARLAAPSIHRDWSNVPAGAWYQSDDETANHYIYFPCEDGEYEFAGMRFDVLRPQILPLVDVRTDYVLSILLLCQRSYNSRAIRSLILKTCTDERVGLPFDGLWFEQGVWKSRNVQAIVSWTEVDEAFSRAGLHLRLRHATTPKAKIIERIFSQEQNAMQELPGYVGRDERNDHFERVQTFIASLKRVGQPRKVEADPRRGLMSAEQYMEHLQRAYDRFNNEPQNGDRLRGMSPSEAWKALSGGKPHQVLSNSLRYLLATEQTEKPVKVTREGICLRIGKEKRYFFESDRLGMLVGERVNVRWNPDFPDHVVVVHPASDPLAQAPFIVKHDPSLDAVNASEDDFAKARKSRSVFTQPQRTLFRMLNHDWGRTIRDETLGSPAQLLAGQAHEEAVSKHVKTARNDRAADETARKLAHRVGFDSSKIKNTHRAVEELSDIEELEARLMREDAEI